MKSEINPLITPDSRIPNFEGTEASSGIETELPQVAPENGQETPEQQVESGDEKIQEVAPLVPETTPTEAPESITEETFEDSINDNLIHESADKVETASSMVDELMNKPTPQENLNSIL